MNRLTERNKKGDAVVAGAAAGTTPTEAVFSIPAILDRLAAYEDTGMTPEEINELKAERSEPCEFCRDDSPNPLGTDEVDITITQVTPCPAIDLGTGKQAEKADPPYYAIRISLDEEGIEEFIPIRHCPKCGRRLVSTRTYESLGKGWKWP